MKIPKLVDELAHRTYPMHPHFWWEIHERTYTLKAMTALRENGAHDIRKLWKTTIRKKAWAMHKYLLECECVLESIQRAEDAAEAWVDYMPSDPKE